MIRLMVILAVTVDAMATVPLSAQAIAQMPIAGQARPTIVVPSGRQNTATGRRIGSAVNARIATRVGNRLQTRNANRPERIETGQRVRPPSASIADRQTSLTVRQD